MALTLSKPFYKNFNFKVRSALTFENIMIFKEKKSFDNKKKSIDKFKKKYKYKLSF